MLRITSLIWDEDNMEYMAKLDSFLILEEAIYTNPIKKLEKYLRP